MIRFGVYCVFMVTILLLLSNTSSGYGYQQQINRADFKFLSSSERFLYQNIYQQILVKVKNAEWQHRPLEKVGNFLEETWYQGRNPGGVLSESFTEKPGNRWYDLATLCYELPNVFGVWFRAGFNPQKEGWGVHFSYAKGGKEVLGDSCSLYFPFFRDGSESFRVSLIKYSVRLPAFYILSGPPYRTNEASLEARNTPLKELQLLIKSPDSLRTRGVQQYNALKKWLHKKISDHKIKKIVFGKCERGGIPPEERVEGLTPEEEREMSGWVDLEIERIIDRIKKYHRIFYDNLAELFPFKKTLNSLNVVDLFNFLDRLDKIRPFSKEETAKLLGVSWSRVPDEKFVFDPGPFNRYIGTVTEHEQGGPGLKGAELRLPMRAAAAADGLLILDFDPLRWDVPYRELGKKMGSSGELVVPHPNEPPDSPVAVCYTGKGEEIRFLYGNSYKDLVGLVVDRRTSSISQDGSGKL